MTRAFPLSLKKNKGFLRLLFLLSCAVLTSPLEAGAAEAETTRLLEPAPSFENSPAFRAVLKSPQSEPRKIDYLLERILRSTSIFVRNGEDYPGKTAVLHMRWKYSRYRHEVKTARDFAEKIANGSRKTGEIYRIRMNDGSAYPAAEILLNELKLLDQALEKARTTADPALSPGKENGNLS